MGRQEMNALIFAIEMQKRIRFCDKMSKNIMHDCALGGQGGPSAPRVEHRYYQPPEEIPWRLIMKINPPRQKNKPL